MGMAAIMGMVFAACVAVVLLTTLAGKGSHKPPQKGD
jgi:hypothetical protein